MIESLVPSLLAAALAALPAQDASAPPDSPEPRTEAPSEPAGIPPAYARWLDEVEQLRDRGDVDGARRRLAELLDAEAFSALAEAPDEAALSALARLDEMAESLGDLAAQRRAREEQVRRLSAALEEDHPDLLRARRHLAVSMQAMGDLPGARALFEAVLAARERTLPENHPDLLRSRGNLAAMMYAQGDLPGARALQEDVLAGYERTLPADHPDLLAARGNLAAMMYAQGDLPGARALQEDVLAGYERTLPADHRDLLRARVNLANTMKAQGDLPGARALEEAVLSGFERTLPEDHPDLLAVRRNLASTRKAQGDLPGARALQEALLASRERTLPEDHPDLLAARGNLAVTMKAMGDLPGARALEEAVLAARERTLPEDHSELLRARGNLAATMTVMGDLPGARALQEAVLESYERTLPEDHPELLGARANLAASMYLMGDLPGARALQEAVLAARERTLPEDHPHLLAARANLAVTMKAQGDHAGARALEEAVLASYERTLSEDHPDLLAARANLAATMKAQGDLTGARALQEAVLASRERILPEDHPDLLAARANLAATMNAQGDLSSARALQEAVLSRFERTRPEDHPDLLAARGNLAATMKAQGDLPGARVLQDAVLASRERTLPPDHDELLRARGNLASTMKAMGDLEGARALGLELARGMLHRLEQAALLSPREGREATGGEALRHAMVRFLSASPESERPDPIRFELAETMRATATVAGHAIDENEPRRLEISRVRARLNDLVSGGPRDGESSEAFAAEVARLTLERDRLLRETRAALAERGVAIGSVRVEDVARVLDDDSVAVGFVRHDKWILDPETSRLSSAGDVLAAHVLRPDGTVTEVELGPAEELADLARDWRSSLGKPIERSLQSGGDAPSEREIGEALRARVLDPLLEVLDDATTTLHVCLDDFLHLVPIGALPLEDGRVRDRYRLVHEVSFARLLGERHHDGGVAGADDLLVMGGVRFDADLGERPVVAGVPMASIEDATRSRQPAMFPPLLQTRIEAEAVALLFEETHDGTSTLLSRDEATKAAFHEHAPGKRFLHVASHGWFAPETVPSTLDAKPRDDALWSPTGASEAVTGLAPMTLCGLAFAGANRGRDSLGRVPGIMTAEELAGIDLTACELAVLSACETNVGIRRAGQGIQSLQTALHAAGARSAITSLWKVDDAATRKLFERFYTYLWADGSGKADALWRAKCDLRAEGHPVRDWAAWVLSGDPR